MKDRLTQLLELFKQANPATRMALAISTLVIVGLAGITSWYANRPDLVQVWSNLNSADAASYKSSLAEAGIPFRASPPPDNGIWVDSSQIDAAYAAVALGGSRPQPRGIAILEEGPGSPFLGSGTRLQMQKKREWQECELILEALDFVTSATVVGSGTERSPFKRDEPQTISVTIDVRHGTTLTPSQVKNVAALVRSCFNVPLENITIMDRTGELLHDGAMLAAGGGGEDLLARKQRYDELVERKIRKDLDQVLGPGLAQVTVNSEWNDEELETISVTPETPVVIDQKSTSTTSTMPGGSVGGAAGLSSNIKDENYGIGNAGTGSSSGAPGGESTTEISDKRSVAGSETSHRRRRNPVLKKLSIALYVDESLAADLESLGKVVKAAAGFDEERGDDFQSLVRKFPYPDRDDEGNPVLPENPEPASPPNEYLMLALEHGVEILAALAFVFILFRTLRGSRPGAIEEAKAAKAAKRGGREMSAAAAAAAEAKAAAESLETIDPALLARAQVEELVRSDPERVSEILAQWAKEEPQRVGAA